MDRTPTVPFQSGSPMMVIGPTNCSKTYWINRLLENDMFTQPVNIEKPKMVTIKTMILRDKLKANVYTLEMPKSYGVFYNKCIVMDDYTTLPYEF